MENDINKEDGREIRNIIIMLREGFVWNNLLEVLSWQRQTLVFQVLVYWRVFLDVMFFCLIRVSIINYSFFV